MLSEFQNNGLYVIEVRDGKYYPVKEKVDTATYSNAINKLGGSDSLGFSPEGRKIYDYLKSYHTCPPF